MKRFAIVLAAITLFAGLFSSCGSKSLTGAGATFPYPLYSRMFDEYHKKTGVKVNYEGIGSGGGINNLVNKMVDFGGTDSPMSDEKIKDAGAQILHIPSCLGAVVVTYNIPNNPELKLTSDAIADIFLGKIAKWNDPKIKALNPEVNLPDLDIIVVHRSDGSGTTYVFTDYLSKVSAEWKTKVGKDKSVNWPAKSSTGQKGNPGVAGYVKENSGAVGYVELAYANQNNMPVALIKNKSGKFIKPSIESVSLAAETTLPDDTRVSLVDTSAADGYPISSFTWLIFYQEQNYANRSQAQAQELIKLLDWVLHDGQQYCSVLDYAPLPGEAVKKGEAILKTVVYNGEKVKK